MITFTEILVWIAFLISTYFLVFWMLVFIEKDSRNFHSGKKISRFPIVSIIVPAYNEEKHIRETLSHLVSLEYPREKLEIIVVNDGSQDQTKAFAEEFVKKHASVKLLSQENKGKGAALNNGI